MTGPNTTTIPDAPDPDAVDPDAVDPDAVDEFLGRFVGDLGAAIHGPLIVLGDKLGLFKALAAGAATPDELAGRTGCSARYLREWLSANAAAGYANYDADSGRFSLDPVQVACLADEASPSYIPGGFYVALSVARDLDRIETAFRSGEGIGWHEHDHNLFHGTAKFFRPSYKANVVPSWIPSLDGVDARLTAGARVADVGCGYGLSTVFLAQAYPGSTFVGFDYHEESVEAARKLASEEGVSDRVTFEVAGAKDYPGTGYDLVAFFDCLHDMGDPVGAASHVLASLASAGTWMIVEPFANDRLEENINPVGRVFYSASTAICTPASLSQEVGLALGAQAGAARLREVVTAGGFSRFRVATETPFNLVIEARP